MYEVPDYEVWNPQYDTLTDKAADDFATIPGLAESWEGSEDGKTYTYTLREGLEWSDGEPLTADDIAFTVNRAREEEWLNYSATVQNLDGERSTSERSRSRARCPDPKLPTMDVYILPEHIWGKLDAEAITKYAGSDGVGSGPFTLTEFKRGQFWRMAANAIYWGGRPEIDEVVFRLFNNKDAMVAALRQGESTPFTTFPTQSFASVESTEGIVALSGQQGGFDEIGSTGVGPRATASTGSRTATPLSPTSSSARRSQHAIDKQTLIDRVLVGLGTPATTISPSAEPVVDSRDSGEEQFTFDLEKANEILDDAGYEDTNGNGIREMPGGGDRHQFSSTPCVPSRRSRAPVAEFVSGWLEEIGIGTTLKPMNDTTLIEVIGKGEYDLFHWGWTPFVDPDPMLSYFVCDQLSSDPENPTDYYNDANWCDPQYDADYKAQNVELDPEKRQEIVHRMLQRMYDSATYAVLYYEGDQQAYRTDRFEGWLRQPAETGPVLFSNTSPTYVNLTSIGAGTSSGDGGGTSTAAIVAIVAVAIAGAGLILYFVRRRRTAEERE